MNLDELIELLSDLRSRYGGYANVMNAATVEPLLEGDVWISADTGPEWPRTIFIGRTIPSTNLTNTAKQETT